MRNTQKNVRGPKDVIYFSQVDSIWHWRAWKLFFFPDQIRLIFCSCMEYELFLDCMHACQITHLLATLSSNIGYLSHTFRFSEVKHCFLTHYAYLFEPWCDDFNACCPWFLFFFFLTERLDSFYLWNMSSCRSLVTILFSPNQESDSYVTTYPTCMCMSISRTCTFFGY